MRGIEPLHFILEGIDTNKTPLKGWLIIKINIKLKVKIYLIIRCTKIKPKKKKEYLQTQNQLQTLKCQYLRLGNLFQKLSQKPSQ